MLDFTDNEIKKLENFPRFARLSCLLMSNNHVSRISPQLAEQVANLQVSPPPQQQRGAEAARTVIVYCGVILHAHMWSNPPCSPIYIFILSRLYPPPLVPYQSLVLTNNRVEALSELEHLAGCSKLTSLSLVGCPVTKREHYRLFAIHTLPGLKVCAPTARHH